MVHIKFNKSHKNTQINVDKYIILHILPYGAESWVINKRRLRCLEQYYQCCHCTIPNIYLFCILQPSTGTHRQSVVKDAGETVGSFSRSRKYMTLSAILYKSHIKKKGILLLYLELHNPPLPALIDFYIFTQCYFYGDLFSPPHLQSLSYKQNVASLSLHCRYFCGKSFR